MTPCRRYIDSTIREKGINPWVEDCERTLNRHPTSDPHGLLLGDSGTILHDRGRYQLPRRKRGGDHGLWTPLPSPVGCAFGAYLAREYFRQRVLDRSLATCPRKQVSTRSLSLLHIVAIRDCPLLQNTKYKRNITYFQAFADPIAGTGQHPCRIGLAEVPNANQRYSASENFMAE